VTVTDFGKCAICGRAIAEPLGHDYGAEMTSIERRASRLRLVQAAGVATLVGGVLLTFVEPLGILGVVVGASAVIVAERLKRAAT
jgi:hypothetical protein